MSVRVGIEELLVGPPERIHANWPAPRLIETALARGEAMLAENGALVVRTGALTGRSPQDKYVVSGPATEAEVWWGSVNQPITAAAFDELLTRALAHLGERDVFVFDGYAGASIPDRLGLRVV